MLSTAPGDGFPPITFPSPLGNLKEAPVPHRGFFFALSKAYEWPNIECVLAPSSLADVLRSTVRRIASLAMWDG